MKSILQIIEKDRRKAAIEYAEQQVAWGEPDYKIEEALYEGFQEMVDINGRPLSDESCHMLAQKAVAIANRRFGWF